MVAKKKKPNPDDDFGVYLSKLAEKRGMLPKEAVQPKRSVKKTKKK